MSYNIQCPHCNGVIALEYSDGAPALVAKKVVVDPDPEPDPEPDPDNETTAIHRLVKGSNNAPTA